MQDEFKDSQHYLWLISAMLHKSKRTWCFQQQDVLGHSFSTATEKKQYPSSPLCFLSWPFISVFCSLPLQAFVQLCHEREKGVNLGKK